MSDQLKTVHTDEEIKIYADELFEILEIESQDHPTQVQKRFTRFLPSKGSFVLVLPYKRIKGHYYYLLERIWVPGWDKHPDLCGISGPAFEEADVSAQMLIKSTTGVEYNPQSFVPLGVAAGSKFSGDITFLFGLDVTSLHETIKGETLVWVEEEELVQILDVHAIVAYSRLKMVP